MGERPLRITIVGINYSPESTGIAPYTTSLAEGLVANGHRVTVVTGYPHYPKWKVSEGYTGFRMDETVRGVHLNRLRHYVPEAPSNVRRGLMEFSFGIRSVTTSWSKPDVVLFASPALIATYVGLLRARVGRKRTVLWVQDLYSRGAVETKSTSGIVARLLSVLETHAFTMADRIVAIHEVFSRQIRESSGLPASRVEVIRNWTHLVDSAQMATRADVRSSMGWREDEIVVLHAGNMGVKQGLENVLDAAKLASKNGSSVRFVLLGDGSQSERLKLLGAGIPNVMFVDPVEDDAFQNVLKAADILLVNELPGIAAMSVPSKLTSYFNSSRPVLAATDAGSATALEIDCSGGGIRVDAGKPDQLLAGVERLGQDKGLATRLGNDGLRFRKEYLEAGGAVRRFEQLLTSIAGAPRRPARVRGHNISS
ncbi:glycosyltransferase family 4 protein [Arthrobacter sp.]|uniref:glycosyltransferase family 4 protein n=1 Tax=Arthrobacter sp. TaxID=1667 RepID=UPI003A8F2B94